MPIGSKANRERVTRALGGRIHPADQDWRQGQSERVFQENFELIGHTHCVVRKVRRADVQGQLRTVGREKWVVAVRSGLWRDPVRTAHKSGSNVPIVQGFDVTLVLRLSIGK